MTPSDTCPKCRTPLPPSSPRGLCPACLMDAAGGETEVMPVPAGFGAPPELDTLRRAFPQFDILAPLGAGGMGRVYKVRQPNLDRIAALKVLPPEFARDPAWVERFTREARALARLNHPNIVQVFDVGQSSSGPDAAPLCWLLMEYVDGVTLRQVQRTGGLSAREALALVPKLCDALQYAHEKGVLHRDIKPENILLDSAGTAKIADFGLAKLAGPHPSPTLTMTGARLGTAAYMAPEQIESPSDVDHRADIYSLGVVLYELLTGGLPLGRFPAPSEKSGTDPRLDHIVFRTLEKERERRYQAAGDMRSALDTVAAAPQPPPLPKTAPSIAPQPRVQRTTRPLTGGDSPVPPENLLKVSYKDRTLSFPGSGTEALGYGCGWLISAPGRIILALLPALLPLIWLEVLREWRSHGLMEKLMPHSVWMAAATGLLAWWFSGPIMRLTKLPERGPVKRKAFVFFLLGLGIWAAVLTATSVTSRAWPATGVRALVQISCLPPVVPLEARPSRAGALKELWERTLEEVYADAPGAVAMETPAWTGEIRRIHEEQTGGRSQKPEADRAAFRALVAGSSLESLSSRVNALARRFMALLPEDSARGATVELYPAQINYNSRGFIEGLVSTENIFAIGALMTLGGLLVRLSGGVRWLPGCALLLMAGGAASLALSPPRLSLPGVLTAASETGTGEQPAGPPAAAGSAHMAFIRWVSACSELDRPAAENSMTARSDSDWRRAAEFWTTVHLLHSSPDPDSSGDKATVHFTVLRAPQWQSERPHDGFYRYYSLPSFDRIRTQSLQVTLEKKENGWQVSDTALLK